MDAEQSGQNIISIHAPSRERPHVITIYQGNVDISIHAPSRERLGLSAGKMAGGYDFNPRSLAGATLALEFLPFLSTYISIHAPSRERQSEAVPAPSARLISIHAPSRERRSLWLHQAYASRFQSTLPRGSDPCRIQSIAL